MPSHYRKLALMVALHFVAMYVLMYAMVDVFGHAYHNLNQLYMAALMTASMVIVEIALMGKMYGDARLNRILLAAGAIALVGSWALIRQQTAIGDRQFLRSMIPHHAGAILMCEEAPIDDAEIRDLCEQIVDAQRREIAEMEAHLTRLDD